LKMSSVVASANDWSTLQYLHGMYVRFKVIPVRCAGEAGTLFVGQRRAIKARPRS
jgi:hypothetical protein